MQLEVALFDCQHDILWLPENCDRVLWHNCNFAVLLSARVNGVGLILTCWPLGLYDMQLPLSEMRHTLA